MGEHGVDGPDRTFLGPIQVVWLKATWVTPKLGIIKANLSPSFPAEWALWK